MSSRHRFLQRSITHVSFHNRLTEEDAMWRRHEHEHEQSNDTQRRYRSRSPSDKRKRDSRQGRSSDNESKKPDIGNNNQTEGEFGPPLPSNLGVNADRWDHALFMQRYPKEYEEQMKKPKREESTSSEDGKKKRKHSKHGRHRRREEEQKKKTKRRHRSRS